MLFPSDGRTTCKSCPAYTVFTPKDLPFSSNTSKLADVELALACTFPIFTSQLPTFIWSPMPTSDQPPAEQKPSVEVEGSMEGGEGMAVLEM